MQIQEGYYGSDWFPDTGKESWKAVYLMKGWSGMRTPMRLVSGLKLRLRRGVRVKTRVTGPGNRLSSSSADTVTCQSQATRMQNLADPDPWCFRV